MTFIASFADFCLKCFVSSLRFVLRMFTQIQRPGEKSSSFQKNPSFVRFFWQCETLNWFFRQDNFRIICRVWVGRGEFWKLIKSWYNSFPSLKCPPQEPDDFLAIPKTLGWFLSAPYNKLSRTDKKTDKNLVTVKSLGRFLGWGLYCNIFLVIIRLS